MKRALFVVGGVALFLGIVAFWWTVGRILLLRSTLSKPPEHGVCFTIEGNSVGEETNAFPALKNAIAKRFSDFGIKIYWQPESNAQFRVYAPIQGPDLLEKAASLVSQTGRLELRLVHPDNDALVVQNKAAEGYELLEAKEERRRKFERRGALMLVSRSPEGGSSGIQIQSAMITRNTSMDTYEVVFALTPDSAAVFKKTTRDNIGRRLAIVMDGQLMAAPVIRSEISQGTGVISSSWDRATAAQTACLLQTPLPIQVKLVDTRKY